MTRSTPPASAVGSDSDLRTTPTSRPVPRFVRFEEHRSGPVLDSASGGSIVTSSTSNPLESEHLRTRCVILVSPGEIPPKPLIDLLRDRCPRQEGLIRAEHPLLALARLAGLERDRRIREETLDGEWPPLEPEKSILVVVNRDHWDDLNPLFGTIRQLMPAVGIWVCTERIAIEIYAGDVRSEGAGETAMPNPIAPESEPEAEPDDAAFPPSDAGEPGDLTQAELQDLLAHFEGFEDDADDFEDESGGPDFGGRPPS